MQANHGTREELTIAGVPVGRELAKADSSASIAGVPLRAGSIIVVLTTDAPLLPHQFKRPARCMALRMARVDSHGGHYCGDIFLAFSTANPGAARRTGIAGLAMLSNDLMTPLFEAVVQGVEEAIVNALVAARTTTGANGRMVYALPHGRLRELLSM